ncbi:MAG: anti-sigma factor domain-containing protein [Kineosporiaceae bacterium]
MQHSDPDVLALVALGEQAPVADAAHLLDCEQCRADVDEMRQVVSAVRVDVTAGAPVAPPPGVWQGIAAETGVRSEPRPERMAGAQPSTSTAPGTAPDTATGPEIAAGSGAAAGPAPGPSTGDELARRRGRRARGGPARGRRDIRLIVAVAAAALVVGAVGGAVGSRLADRTPPPATQGPAGPAGQILAQVQLANLKPATTGASGSAQVVRTPAGPRLEIDVARLAPMRGHFYEVWLIDSQVKKMVSLGILDGTTGEFVIPNGVDVSAYPIVDISVQQPGDPKHSGDSVLRGTIWT